MLQKSACLIVVSLIVGSNGAFAVPSIATSATTEHLGQVNYQFEDGTNARPNKCALLAYATAPIKILSTGRKILPLKKRPPRNRFSPRVRAQIFPSTPSRVWITDFTDASGVHQAKLDPSGARFYQITPEIEWRAATGTGDDASGFMIINNGIPQATDGCYSDGAGGGGSPFGGTCPGLNVLQIQETTISGKMYYSDPVNAYWSCGPNREFPKNPPKKCKDCGQTGGDPIDVIDGDLHYSRDDMTLSGPFGLQFHRFYDSKAAMTETLSGVLHRVEPDEGFYYINDIGFGWQHSYSAFLDFTSLAQGNAVSFFDEQAHRVYFGGVTPGQTVTEPINGYSIFESTDSKTYKVTTFHGLMYQFSCCDRTLGLGYLTSITDRLGNTQTITRDTSTNHIQTVTDSLGRTLNFTYDTSGRISQVTSSPAGAKMTFTYDSGTNCTSGELCTATENSGAVWHYQYSDDDVHSGTFPEINHDLVAVQDPNNNFEEQNTYLALKPLNWGRGTTYAITQSRGGKNSLTYSYPNAPENATTTITDTLGRVTTYQNDFVLRQVTTISGGPACEVCGGNQSMSYIWDNFNRLQTFTDGDGATHTITYAYGDDTPRTYPDGTSYTINPILHLTSVSEPLSNGKNRIRNYAWYAAGDPRQDLINISTIPSTDTSGQHKTITDTYDIHGLLQSEAVRGYVNAVAETHTTSFSYDTAGRGRLTQVSGPRTDVTQQTTLTYYPDNDSDFARRGQLQTITRQVNGTTTLATTLAGDSAPNNTYTTYGGPLSIVDPNGVVADLAYDNIGELTSKTIKGVTGDTAALITSFAYDLGHRLTTLTWPLTNGLSYTYDAANNLISMIRTAPTNNFQEERLLLGYDIMSQLTSQQAQACATPATSCASWNTTQQETFKPDNYGRLSEVDHPCTPSCYKVVYGYDAAGNLQTVQDENHSSANTTYGYDYANRLISMTQTLSPSNILTQYGYDVHDNVNSVIDPNSNTTTYAYDDFDRMRQQNSPVTGTSTYAYDFDDDLTTYTDANSATTTATYDAIDRILTATSVHGASNEPVSWVYDDTTSGHFGKGRLKTMTDPTGSVNYTYERRGLLASEARTILTYAYNLSYKYDKNGNRSSITYPDAKVITYGFDFADRPNSIKNGATTLVSSVLYMPFGPRTQISFGNSTVQALTYNQRYQISENKLSGSATIADYIYAEDGVGNITQIHDATDATGAHNRDFGPYDDLNRLTIANSGSSLWGSGTGNGYQYDKMGNVTSLQLGTLHTATFSYSGTLPRLASVTDSTLNSGNPQSIGYDATGNQITIGAATYTYSPRNFLATGDGFTYKYDGFGRRTVTQGSPGTRYSFYDPSFTLLSESALVGSGKPGIKYDYIWLGGAPVAQIDNTGILYTFDDHLGSPQAQTDSAQSIYWRAEYEPYGRVIALRAGDVHQPLRLPGQVSEQFDAGANGSTTRHYNNYRWYQPGWGKYSTADPVQLAGGNNLYRYTLDNPVFHSDILGLDILIGFDPSGAIGFGHNFMVIYDPQTLQGSIYSFGSSNGSPILSNAQIDTSPVDLSNLDSFGKYSDLQMFQFQTTENQDAAMRDYWQNLIDSTNHKNWWKGRHYNFLTSNCIEAVRGALEEGGRLPGLQGAPNLNDVAKLLTIYPNQSIGALILQGYNPIWPNQIMRR